jgi:hypothetical protein
MKKILDNMWTFALFLLVIAMGLSAAVYFGYMRAHLIG